MAKEKYNLFGAMFLYPSYPNDIYPVFEKGNQLFLQEYNNSTIIDNFVLIDEEHYPLILVFDDNYCIEGKKCIVGELDDSYSIGSDCVIGLQLSEDSYFLGNFESLMECLNRRNFAIDNQFIREDIEELEKKNSIKKQYLKKKDFQK